MRWKISCRLAPLPLALAATALAGCPDTSENAAPSSISSVGKLSLVQTIVGSDDPDISNMGTFLLSPTDEKLYANSWHSGLVTLDRSAVDGSLERSYEAPLFNGSGLAMTGDGKHLYGVGANAPDQLMRFDVDPVTGEPLAQSPSILVRGSQVTVASQGAWLYEGAEDGEFIRAYRIDPASGALETGPATPHDSPLSGYWLAADDELGSLFAERVTDQVLSIVRYAVDATSGALTKQAEAVADLSWGYVVLARCPGTTRMYVAQDAGNIGYADVGGTGLDIPSSFAHPDLAHARSATLSPDCKNLYVVTQQGVNGSLVVLARDDGGDLSWLQTIPMGPGTPLFAITQPTYPLTSLDGKNVYLASTATNEGFAVFQRDTTGEGLL